MTARDKAAIRHELLARRDALTQDDRHAASDTVSDRLRGEGEYKAAKAVLLYVSFRSEVGTRGLIEAALKDGKTVIVPKVDRKAHRLKLFEIKDVTRDLEAGYMGIYEPVEHTTRLAGPKEVDLVVLPGVGFDEAGRRLGYGGGYYDRLLEELKPGAGLIALAFEAQIVEEIPAEPHDKRVGKVVTEKRTIKA
ncbi:MAG: 5-formyltetrahydrofolate cyclo-ligase [Nitrospirae bacterium]|nr:5-formyltetrahydrofolate cyclo-ligase [Nitrospirota bacterium]MBI5694383.1 5-formyltetrahydrofolate cyclo-ligase [Nitrospirota bacterium]